MKTKTTLAFSILEIIVALAVFIMLAASILTLVLGAFNSLSAEQDYLRASELLNSGTARIRIMADSNWLALQNNQDVVANFTRLFKFYPICRMGQNLTNCPLGTIDVNSLRAQVIITWTSGLNQKQISSEIILRNHGSVSGLATEPLSSPKGVLLTTWTKNYFNYSILRESKGYGSGIIVLAKPVLFKVNVSGLRVSPTIDSIYSMATDPNLNSPSQYQVKKLNIINGSGSLDLLKVAANNGKGLTNSGASTMTRVSGAGDSVINFDYSALTTTQALGQWSESPIDGTDYRPNQSLLLGQTVGDAYVVAVVNSTTTISNLQLKGLSRNNWYVLTAFEFNSNGLKTNNYKSIGKTMAHFTSP